MKRIDKGTFTIGVLEAVEVFLISSLVVGFALWGISLFKDIPGLVFVIIALYLTGNLVKGILSEKYFIKNTRYELTEKHVQLISGSWTLEDMVIPKYRIQHVSMGQSFYSRMLNLYSVTIYTAGNNMFIGYLKQEDALTIKDEITAYLADQEGEQVVEEA